jgi:hypothetical protein
MAIKIKPMVTKHMVGHVPFKSDLTRDTKKGVYLVQTTVQGKTYVGQGDSERLATIDLRRQLNANKQG